MATSSSQFDDAPGPPWIDPEPDNVRSKRHPTAPLHLDRPNAPGLDARGEPTARTERPTTIPDGHGRHRAQGNESDARDVRAQPTDYSSVGHAHDDRLDAPRG